MKLLIYNNFFFEKIYLLFFSNLIKFTSFLLYLLPLALISGPAISDWIISLSSIFFLYLTYKKKDFIYFKNKYFIFFICWCFYLIIRSLFSIDPFLSLESSLFYFRFGFFALSVFFLTKYNIKFIKYFTFSLLFTYVFVLFDAYLQFFLGYNIIGIPYDGVRLNGLTGNEQILGSYLSRLLPLFFALTSLQFSKSKKMILFSMIILILSDIIIFLSGERAAFFYLFLSTILIILLTVSLKKIRLFTFVISLVFIFLISFFQSTTFDRMVINTYQEIMGEGIDDNCIKYNTDCELVTKKPISFFGSKIYLFSKYHTAHMQSAYKMFQNNILFGIGPKNFRIACEFQKYYVLFGCQTHPHNTYVQLLSETGLVGFVPIFIIFLVICYFFLTQLRFYLGKKNKVFSNYLICLYICVFISLWPLIPTGSFFNNWLSIIYYLPIGFILHAHTTNVKYFE